MDNAIKKNMQVVHYIPNHTIALSEQLHFYCVLTVSKLFSNKTLQRERLYVVLSTYRWCFYSIFCRSCMEKIHC